MSSITSWMDISLLNCTATQRRILILAALIYFQLGGLLEARGDRSPKNRGPKIFNMRIRLLSRLRLPMMQPKLLVGEVSWQESVWLSYMAIGVARGAYGPCPPKFLEHMIILCIERQYTKQISVIRLKSNIFPPQNFWAGYATDLCCWKWKVTADPGPLFHKSLIRRRVWKKNAGSCRSRLRVYSHH